MEINFPEIESKWKSEWAESSLYKVSEKTRPSQILCAGHVSLSLEAGLHVGHPLGYVASDIVSRYKRLKGFNVLHPWASMPLVCRLSNTPLKPVPTHASRPREHQLLSRTAAEDRVPVTTGIGKCRPAIRPSTKWTQWIFMQLFNSWYDRSAESKTDI